MRGCPMRKASKKTVKKVRKPSKKTLKFFRKIVKKISRRKTTRRRKKFVAQKPVFSISAQRASFEMPRPAGENKLVLLVRDPWWIFAFWELTPGHGNVDKRVLRVYDVTDVNPQAPRSFFDVEFGSANCWYVEVGEPDHQWVAEIGWLSREGQFFALIRSNIVRTPRYGVSDVIDEEWMLSDELSKKLYQLAGAGKSFSSFEAHSEVIR